jgi:uncharacterized protein YhbP (UPF0306 family)
VNGPETKAVLWTRVENRQPMPIERSHRPIAATRLSEIARRLLEASTLCAISTVTPAGLAHVNTAYFAWSPELDVIWLSEPRARHSRNVRGNPSVAIAVYDSTQTWGTPDRGIQLLGRARRAAEDEIEWCVAVYTRRFAAFVRTDLGAYRFFLFRPRRLKLFDEAALGAGVFVTATVRRDGRLTWNRTEVYRSEERQVQR